jgi:hypothetical protein
MPRGRDEWKHVALVVVTLAIFGSVIATVYTENTERALVALAAYSVLLALIAVMPKRPRRTQALLDASQIHTEMHLRRIVELLEQQQSTTVLTTTSPPPRRSTSRVLALALVSLVVARALARR